MREQLVHFSISIFLLCLCIHAKEEFDVRDIAEKSFLPNKAKNVIRLNSLSINDANVAQRNRSIRDYCQGSTEEEKNVFVIDEPVGVPGSALLAYNWHEATKDDDSWIYLTALNKKKRTVQMITMDARKQLDSSIFTKKAFSFSNQMVADSFDVSFLPRNKYWFFQG